MRVNKISRAKQMPLRLRLQHSHHGQYRKLQWLARGASDAGWCAGSFTVAPVAVTVVRTSAEAAAEAIVPGTLNNSPSGEAFTSGIFGEKLSKHCGHRSAFGSRALLRNLVNVRWDADGDRRGFTGRLSPRGPSRPEVNTPGSREIVASLCLPSELLSFASNGTAVLPPARGWDRDTRLRSPAVARSLSGQQMNQTRPTLRRPTLSDDTRQPSGRQCRGTPRIGRRASRSSGTGDARRQTERCAADAARQAQLR
jgi:hypothetical protein